MSGFNSGSAARLLIQVASEIALHRHCPRCKRDRRFVSSDKFRVNAQKKRIDAWLVFRCVTCDDRWNWPVHERRPVAALDPAELDALMRNDPDLAARHGMAALRMHATSGPDPAPIVRRTLEPATGATRAIEIVVALRGARPRFDRLLAQALMLTRSEIETLAEAGAMAVARKALRRPASDGQRIVIALDRCAKETAARLRQGLAAQLPDLYCATLSPR